MICGRDALYMDQTQRTASHARILIESAREDYQHAMELYRRELWFAAEGRRAAAEKSLDQLIELLDAAGL